MRATELEARVLEIADRVARGQRVEDSRVECKRDWPGDFHHAARQLAGHANAARGEPILWMIGVDEKGAAVPGASYGETSNWLAQLRSWFDGNVPTNITHVTPRHGEHATVISLLFETDRAPYVVRLSAEDKKGAAGATLETPWHEGGATRSARHEDLVRLLVPLVKLPTLEILEAHVSCTSKGRGSNPVEWYASATVYVRPRSVSRLVFPFHDCALQFEVEQETHAYSIQRPSLQPLLTTVETMPPRTVLGSVSEVIVDGPGSVVVSGFVWGDFPTSGSADAALDMHLLLRPDGAEGAATVSQRLPVSDHQRGARYAWDYKRSPSAQPPGPPWEAW